MRARVPIFLVLALAVVTAGCLNLDPSSIDEQNVDPEELLEEIGVPIVQDHDHADPAQHGGSANVELVDYNPLVEWPDQFGQTGYAEVSVHGDHAYVAVLGSPGGFFVVDVSDPAATEVVGRYKTAGFGTYDVKVCDEDTVVLGVQGASTSTEAVEAAAQGSDAAAQGFHVVDVSDRANPEFVAYHPVPPSGSHNVFCYQMDDRTLVFSTSSNFAFDPTGQTGFLAADPIFTKVVIAEVVDTPAGREVRPLSDYRMVLSDPTPWVTDQRNINSMVYVHDMFAQEHPVTGQHLLYVAHWEAGLRIVDISDPANPEEVGAFDEKGPAEYMNTHYVQPHPTLIDGKHVTVVAPELLVSRDSGWIRVLDTTDPENPSELGRWELPGDIVNDQNLLFSPHNLDLDHGRIYLGHYHAGAWVIDIGNATNLANPETVGYYLPNGDGSHVLEKGETYADTGYFEDGVVPNVWGSVYADGYIFVSDISSGLYVLRQVDDPVAGTT